MRLISDTTLTPIAQVNGTGLICPVRAIVLGRFFTASLSLLPLRILLTGGLDFLLLYGDETISSGMLLEVVRSMAGSTRVEDGEVVRGWGSFGSLRTAAAAESRVERLVSNASLHRRYERCS
jgi:hypothetical protein